MAFPSGEMYRNAGGAARVPMVRFTTAELPPGDRLAAWGGTVSALFDRCATRRRQPFSGALTAYHFGSFLLCHSRSDGARYIRSAPRSRLDDLDHYLIHLPLHQAGGFGLAGTLRRLRPMDVGIFDLASPAAYVAGAGESISVILPRHALALLLREPNRQHGRILCRSRPLTGLLARHLIALRDAAPDFAMHEATALANAVIDLIAICLGHDGGSGARAPPPAPPAAKESLARRIRSYIEYNLHRDSLTPDAIVKELAISRSQLYRQFEHVGGVRHYMRRRRLRKALLAICNPLRAGQRIADIAYDHGFADEAHFSRLFRESFGLSPREARQAMQRGDAALLAALVPPAPADPEASAETGVEAGAEAGAQAGAASSFAHWIRELAIG